MSSTTSVTSSSSLAYATQLAETSSIKRSLYKLGVAIQEGDVSSAKSILTAFIKEHPEYSTTTANSTTDSSTSDSSDSSSSSNSSSSINSDFTSLASALDANDGDAAKTAWGKIKTDMAALGVTNIQSPSLTAAQVTAQSKATMETQMMETLFGTSSTSGSDTATLLGLNSDSSSTSDPLSAIVSEWQTYKADSASNSTSSSSSSGTTLDTLV